eukprot:8648286-Heterocapsa_arctica.AAC.1
MAGAKELPDQVAVLIRELGTGLADVLIPASGDVDGFHGTPERPELAGGLGGWVDIEEAGVVLPKCLGV